MSVNVRNMRSNDGENAWELRRELLFAVIRRNRPDVVATQEAYFPQVEQMQEALPDYDRVGVGRDDGKREGETCALFYLHDRFGVDQEGTFWFSDTPDVPGSRHETCSLPRVCTWVRLIETSGTAFSLYNVHLDHQSQSAREQSIRILLERIQSSSPAGLALVVGDFNMEEANPALAYLQGETDTGFRDTFRVIHPDEKVCGTFHGFTGRTDGEKIDYIYASPSFEVLDARILYDNAGGRYPSDHFPITACVRF